jgi:hypothetical protein
VTSGFVGGGLGQLSLRTAAKTRSISAENVTGEKGRGAMATEGTGAYAAGSLGQGWKVSPSVKIAAGETYTIADIAGPGVIQHIWLTTHYNAWRRTILRFYWEGESSPAVEVPLGDFFCNGWSEFS